MPISPWDAAEIKPPARALWPAGMIFFSGETAEAGRGRPPRLTGLIAHQLMFWRINIDKLARPCTPAVLWAGLESV
jgi:hypothetical protein